MKKRVRRKKEKAGNYVVIKIPASLQKKYPDICDFIRSLSPKERGSLIINMFLVAGFAINHGDIEIETLKINSPENKSKPKRSEGIISKNTEVEEI